MNMIWQELDDEKQMLISQLEELDPLGYYREIYTDAGFVDLLYEVFDRNWDYDIVLSDSVYNITVINNGKKSFASDENKYYALALAYFDALYTEKNDNTLQYN